MGRSAKRRKARRQPQLTGRYCPALLEARPLTRADIDFMLPFILALGSPYYECLCDFAYVFEGQIVEGATQRNIWCRGLFYCVPDGEGAFDVNVWGPFLFNCPRGFPIERLEGLPGRAAVEIKEFFLAACIQWVNQQIASLKSIMYAPVGYRQCDLRAEGRRIAAGAEPSILACYFPAFSAKHRSETDIGGAAAVSLCRC